MSNEDSATNESFDLSGRQIGRYVVERRLGSGGVATVYQAYDQVQGISVALKLLTPGADEATQLRFGREAQMAGALRHPHIVRILQIGNTALHGIAYIAMELVEGESLSGLLAAHGRLRSAESCNLLEPIARALAEAHRAGIIHRDVKPSNILLRPASPGAPHSVQLESLDYPVIPLLSDFGIARALDAPELTSTGRTVGTPAYMAPEQCVGQRTVDGRADIYALGAVLYRCVSGRLPFTGTTTQILHAHVYESLTIDDHILEQLTPLLVRVLQRSLAKRPEDRYATANDLADDLAVAAGRAIPRPALVSTPQSAVSESSATLTLSALPSMAGTSSTFANPLTGTSATTVLIPAPSEEATRTPPPLPIIRQEATLEEFRLEDEADATDDGSLHWLRWQYLRRSGLGLMAVGVTIFAVVAFALASSTFWLRVRDVLPVTPLPSATEVAVFALTATFTPTPLPTSTATVPPTSEPTSAAVAVPTDPPPAITLAPPTATETPVPTLTDTPTPLPTATLTVTPSPVVSPTPQSVQFAPGAIASLITGTVEYPIRNGYVLRALAGQVMTVEVASATNTAMFELSGLQDKIIYKALEAPTHITRFNLPSTQDYLVAVTPANNGVISYTLTITVITPPPTPTPGPPCNSVPADIFYGYVQAMNAVARQDFQCLLTISQSINGQYLEFERGFMLQVEGQPAIYVWYREDDHWSSLVSDWQEGEPVVGSTIPPSVPTLYQPERAMGRVWERNNLITTLGFALAPTPTPFTGSQQDFNGGTLIANQQSGAIFPFGNNLKR